MLPGSRGGEVRRMLPVFGETIGSPRERAGPFELVLPTVPHLARARCRGDRELASAAAHRRRPEEKWAAFRIARAALAASGTVTLELAVAGVPTVVAYKISLLEELVGHLMVRTPTIVLANLVLGENIMPEFVQRAATPERLAAALLPLIGPSRARSRQLAAFARFDEIMGIGRARRRRRADVVLGMLAAQATA